MKFAIMSLVAAGALAATAGSASAQYRGGYGNYNRGYSNYGNFNRGYSNYGNYGGYNRGFNNYGGFYGSGTNISVGRPGGIGITFGSGNVYPSYYGGGYNRSYYGGGYGSYYGPNYGYGGRRW